MLRSHWAQYSYTILERLPDITDLDNWLDNCAMAEYCVRAGSDRASTSSAHLKDRQEQKGGGGVKAKGLHKFSTGKSSSGEEMRPV